MNYLFLKFHNLKFRIQVRLIFFLKPEFQNDDFWPNILKYLWFAVKIFLNGGSQHILFTWIGTVCCFCLLVLYLVVVRLRLLCVCVSLLCACSECVFMEVFCVLGHAVRALQLHWLHLYVCVMTGHMWLRKLLIQDDTVKEARDGTHTQNTSKETYISLQIMLGSVPRKMCSDIAYFIP